MKKLSALVYAATGLQRAIKFVRSNRQMLLGVLVGVLGTAAVVDMQVKAKWQEPEFVSKWKNYNWLSCPSCPKDKNVYLSNLTATETRLGQAMNGLEDKIDQVFERLDKIDQAIENINKK
jgi:hypothetical protein